MGECLDKAIQLVARRPHFRRELEKKLSDRGFSTAGINAALAELTQQGWIDDLAHARGLATGSMARRGFGPRKTLFELQRRGVDPEMAERVIAEVFSDPREELDRARQVASRKASVRPIEPDRLARHLDRKGFSKAVIMQILRETDGA